MNEQKKNSDKEYKLHMQRLKMKIGWKTSRHKNKKFAWKYNNINTTRSNKINKAKKKQKTKYSKQPKSIEKINESPKKNEIIVASAIGGMKIC